VHGIIAGADDAPPSSERRVALDATGSLSALRDARDANVGPAPTAMLGFVIDRRRGTVSRHRLERDERGRGRFLVSLFPRRSDRLANRGERRLKHDAEHLRRVGEQRSRGRDGRHR
jgi:hypothetical protein